MKPLLLLVVFGLYTFAPLYAQQAPVNTSHETYESYMKKRKNNRGVGWLLLGGGLVFVVGGTAINLRHNLIFDSNTSDDNEGLWAVYLGGASMLASVPFFVAAGDNKKKALMVKNQPAATLQPLKFRSMPSLTFVINF